VWDVGAKAVRAYAVEIKTGPTEDEEGSQATVRAMVRLLGEPGEALGEERGEPIGHIYFYGPEVTLESDFVSRASRPILHLHTDMLSGVLNLLESEKPVFVELREPRGRLTTDEESIVKSS
jgi:hypothetical protein